MENVPTEILVHHTAAVAPNPQFAAINEWHKARQFPISSLGYYVGYHYVIEKDGTVRQARMDNEEGSHAHGSNFVSLGICLVGDFDIEWPTDAQIIALGALLETKCREHSIEPSAIYPHRHAGSTSCYGSRLSDDWAQKVLAWFEFAKTANIEQQELNKLRENISPRSTDSPNP